MHVGVLECVHGQRVVLTAGILALNAVRAPAENKADREQEEKQSEAQRKFQKVVVKSSTRDGAGRRA